MLSEVQQITILKFLLWNDRSSNPRSTALEACTLTITPRWFILLQCDALQQLGTYYGVIYFRCCRFPLIDRMYVDIWIRVLLLLKMTYHVVYVFPCVLNFAGLFNQRKPRKLIFKDLTNSHLFYFYMYRSVHVFIILPSR